MIRRLLTLLLSFIRRTFELRLLVVADEEETFEDVGLGDMVMTLPEDE